MATGGKLAVVIGGATGIGAGICHALARRGYRIALCDIDSEGALALSRQLPPGRIFVHEVDVTKPSSLDAANRAIRAGGASIDLVFANAGSISLKPFLETDEADWKWLFSINLLGTVNTVKAFLPGLLAQSAQSRICVTSSVAALRTPAMVGQTMYMATKSAQLGFANGLRTELEGTKVALSVIFPGPVKTALRQKSEARRPGAVKVEVPTAAAGPGMISPEEAGERIVSGVEESRDFIGTHPGERALVREMQDRVIAAFD